MAQFFKPSHLRAIADALGDTDEGLTGSEIGHLLTMCRMADPAASMTNGTDSTMPSPKPRTPSKIASQFWRSSGTQ